MLTIAANYIFTGRGEALKNAALVLDKDGRLVDILPEFKEAEHIRFYDGILCPGMTNAHCHMELSEMKGLIPEHTGLGGFVHSVVALRGRTKLKQEAASRYDKSMFKAGIDAVGDICNDESGGIWKEHSRIRYRNFIEVFGSDPLLCSQKWEQGLRTRDEFRSRNLQAGISPHAIYSMSQELFALSLAEGFKEGVLSLHFMESPDELHMLKNITDEHPVDYLIRQLSHIPEPLRKTAHLLLVHCTYASREDIDRICEWVPNTFVVTCPRSNLYIEKRLANLPDLLKSQARLCLGTDSLASNHSLSLLDEMICIRNNYPEITFFEILHWACENGAMSMKFDGIGRWKLGEQISICRIGGMDLHRFKPSENVYSERI